MTEDEKLELEWLKSQDDIDESQFKRIKELEAKAKIVSDKPVNRGLFEGRVGVQRMSEAEAKARTTEWKDNVMSSLRSLYKGDFDAFVDNVRAGKKPKNPSTEQQHLIGVVKQLDKANTADELVGKMQLLSEGGNKFADYVTRMNLRKTWQSEYDPDTGDIVEPTTGQAIANAVAPNFMLRTQDPEASLFGKGMGLVQDVFSIPSRAVTGTIEQLTPQGRADKDLAWYESYGRPDPYSTGGERLIDFTVSAPIPGRLIEKGVETTAKVGAKLLPKTSAKVLEAARNTPGLRNLVSETPSAAVLGPYLKGADMATDIPVWEQALAGGIKGGYQGLTYGAVPSAVMMTNPEEASPNAMEEGLTSLALSPLFGAGLGTLGGAGRGTIGKLGGEPTVSRWGDELTGGYRSFERLKEATKDIPLSDSRAGVKMIDDVNKALDEVITQNAEARNMAAQASRPTWSPDVVAKSMQTNLKEVPEEIAIFPGQAATYQELVENIAQKYFTPSQLNPGDYTPTMEQLVKARTFLGRMQSKATDPEKKFMVTQALDKVKTYMDELGGKSTTFDIQSPLANTSLASFAQGRQVRTSDVLDPKYAEMQKVYGMKDRFVDPEGAEGVLRKFGSARLSPLDRSQEVGDMVTAMEGITSILNKNGVKSPSGGSWTMEDVDFITPAVAREIRKRLKFEDGNTFGMLLGKLTEGASLFSPSAMAYKLTKPSIKGASIGTGIAPYMVSEDSEDVDQIDMIPLFDTTKVK